MTSEEAAAAADIDDSNKRKIIRVLLTNYFPLITHLSVTIICHHHHHQLTQRQRCMLSSISDEDLTYSNKTAHKLRD